jgi:hypothetical protein
MATAAAKSPQHGGFVDLTSFGESGVIQQVRIDQVCGSSQD